MTTKADGEHESLSSAAARSAGHGRPGDAIRNPITGRRILLQTIDTETDGLTPSDREWLSNVRLMYNKESGDYLVLVSKNIPIDEIDWETFNEAMRPIVREIGRPRNHGQSQSGLDPDREWALINVRRMVK